LFQGQWGQKPVNAKPLKFGGAVTASSDNTARLWDATDGTLISVLEGHTKCVWDATFSPDDKRIVTSTNDGTARLWDAVSGKTIAVLGSKTSGVLERRINWSATFSPDGGRIVIHSSYPAEVWEILGTLRLSSIMQRRSPLAASRSINSAAFIWQSRPAGALLIQVTKPKPTTPNGSPSGPTARRRGGPGYWLKIAARIHHSRKRMSGILLHNPALISFR
jgi:WD40 repeat protein